MSSSARGDARAALVGHPSDGYGGAVLAMRVRSYWTEISIDAADQIEVGMGARVRCDWATLPEPSDYDGALALTLATLRRFGAHCVELTGAPPPGGCRIAVSANTIPREVGLAGSSALILALWRALAAHYGLEINSSALPEQVLAVEVEELGIAAGPQDRVIQVHGGLALMEFGARPWTVQPLDPALLPPLFLGHRPSSAEPSGRIHGDLRRRFERGDAAVLDAMRDLADLALEARDALLAGDHAEFARVLDDGFDVRSGMLSLDPRHVELVEVARACGARATFTGSGGAVVGTVPSVDVREALRREFGALGWPLIEPRVG